MSYQLVMPVSPSFTVILRESTVTSFFLQGYYQFVQTEKKMNYCFISRISLTPCFIDDSIISSHCLLTCCLFPITSLIIPYSLATLCWMPPGLHNAVASSLVTRCEAFTPVTAICTNSLASHLKGRLVIEFSRFFSWVF